MNTRRKEKGSSSRQNQLRIIGGIWRGRKFSFPDAAGLRPTGDRIRETLFNWLAPEIHNASVVDLFAGSGALGIEAVSRGASHAVLVESNPTVSKQLQTSLAQLNDKRLHAVTDDACHFIANWAGSPFNIVFLDPPFHHHLLEEAFELLTRPGILAEHALVYVETDLTEPVPPLPENWKTHREKQSGNVCFRLYRTN